jgi:hypothetical protein
MALNKVNGTCSYKAEIPYVNSRRRDERLVSVINRNIAHFQDRLQTRFQIQESLSKNIQRCLNKTLTIDWNVEYLTTLNAINILSFKLISEYYQTGDTHGLPLQHGMTFSTKTGRLLSLSNLVPPKQRKVFLQHFHTHWRKQTATNRACIYEPARQFKFNELKNFFLTKDRLVIFFNVYEVAPYVCGVTEITMHLSNLPKVVTFP